MDKVGIANRIKRIRKEKGLNQEEFGKLVQNAHKSLVSKWEKGQNLPNNERLKIIASIGNISVDELIYGDEELFPTKVFLSEVRKFHDRYKEKEKGLAIVRQFDFDETLRDFEKWIEENKHIATYDNEKAIREISRKLILSNIEKNKDAVEETELSSLEKARKSIYDIEFKLEEDFFYGTEDEDGEIELRLKKGMTQETYDLATSILSNTAAQLLALEKTIELKKD